MGPGKSLFDAISKDLGEINIIAEDLVCFLLTDIYSLLIHFVLLSSVTSLVCDMLFSQWILEMDKDTCQENANNLAENKFYNQFLLINLKIIFLTIFCHLWLMIDKQCSCFDLAKKISSCFC